MTTALIIWAVIAIGTPSVWIIWIDIQFRRRRRRQINAGLAILRDIRIDLPQ